MLVMTNAEVLMRTAFHSPIPLVIELSGFCFAFTTFFTLALVVRERRELTVDFVVGRLPARTRLALRSIYDAIGIIAFGVICWAAWGKLRWSASVGDYIPSDPPLPTIIPWTALTVGLAMLVVALLVDLLVSLKALAGNGSKG
ncbi:MAG: hypothetical protein BroJett024_39900 [Alphaproteobacteria bacterium]|nr:MAG: hypothetical protein BroJett024_39900 [Alphaproteobacteria bacterium]